MAFTLVPQKSPRDNCVAPRKRPKSWMRERAQFLVSVHVGDLNFDAVRSFATMRSMLHTMFVMTAAVGKQRHTSRYILICSAFDAFLCVFCSYVCQLSHVFFSLQTAFSACTTICAISTE